MKFPTSNSPVPPLSCKWFSVFRTSTGFLLGVMLFLSFGVAPVLFRNYPTAEAGAIMGTLFPVYYHTVYAGVLIALAALIAGRRQVPRFWAVLALLIFAAVFMASNEFQIGPAMERARALPGREIFRKLHGLSMVLNLLSMVAVTISIFLIGPPRGCNSLTQEHLSSDKPD